MIFIDFDDTIFDTNNFKKEYFEIFHAAGISKKLFDSTYYFKNGNEDGQIYHYEKHLEKLEKEMGKSLAQAKTKLEHFLADTSRFIFRDFWKFSSSFDKKVKILLSYGCKPFQPMKIESSGISGEFNKVITTCGKKSKIISKIIEKLEEKKDLYFLDDRPEQLEDICENMPEVTCIRVRRKHGRYFKLPTKSDLKIVEVPNLLQAAEVIKQTSA